MSDRIVCEIFAVRPSEAKAHGEDRKGHQLEVLTMIGQLNRVVGKPPKGVRLALLAGHENIVCFFDGNNRAHWAYVDKITEKWPKHWDFRATEKLAGKKEPVATKPTTATAAFVQAADKLLIDKMRVRHNVKQQTGSRAATTQSPNGTPDSATGNTLPY